MKKIATTLFFIIVSCYKLSAQGPCIQVISRPSPDSISLRWAPLTYSDWTTANQNGYIVERYTLVRNGLILTKPEVNILTPTPLKPLPEAAWEPLVNREKYAAIAAQALYGGSFEIDMGQSDVFQIVNKAKENEQRFQFALFSADMSPLIAKASGLYFTDKSVKQDEKYLYRIKTIHQGDTCMGSIYTSPTDIYKLPTVKGVKAERNEDAVVLKWTADRLNFYTAYKVERSEDGTTFKSISDEAILNVSPTETETASQIFASDSVKSAVPKLYYRVIGITPFGEEGPAERASEASLSSEVEDAPFIHTGFSENNKTIQIEWTFPDKLKHRLKGFYVSRSDAPKSTYKRISPLLPNSSKSFTDTTPENTNYYRVSAISLTGEEIQSSIYFVPLIDSIPPGAPESLQAIVDEYGNVSLTWAKNTEGDLYGYRVYKANYKGEELFQVTSEPIRENQFTDRVQLNALNKKVYYQLMAVDKMQNHSALSELLEVKLPDKVKPVSPIFLPLQSTDDGIELRWLPSSSDDVVKYELYRQPRGEKQWIRIFTAQSTKDSLYQYRDNNLLSDSYKYTVVAIDDSGLESDPAHAIEGNRISTKLKPAIVLMPPVIDNANNKVSLKWTYDSKEVRNYQIFRAVGSGSTQLYKTIPPESNEFTDQSLVPGQEYSYRIMAIFKNQSKSSLSESVKVTF